MPIAESEICVVLGNLLDNAIEAASKTEENTGWVKITIGQQNEMTFLKIENNYQEEPVTKNGEYVTTKENKKCTWIWNQKCKKNHKKPGWNDRF